jgi:hypothetical protein
MPAIGTAGSTSGDGKRSVGHSAPSYRAHPRLYRSGPAGMSASPPLTGADRTFVRPVRIGVVTHTRTGRWRTLNPVAIPVTAEADMNRL